MRLGLQGPSRFRHPRRGVQQRARWCRLWASAHDQREEFKMHQGKALLLALAAFAFTPSAFAADHRDGPLATGDPAADLNDIYLFVNPNNPAETIIINTYFPAATLNSRFSDAVEYKTFIENSAGGQTTITCRSTGQGATVSCTGPGGLAASGTLNRTNVGTGMRLWAGIRDDPFFFDLDAFNATRGATPPAPPANRFRNPGVNFFGTMNTLVMAFGIESARLTGNGANPRLKVWASSNRLGDFGIQNGISGSWYDPAQPGYGVHIEVLAPATAGGPNRVAMAWYTYNRQGGGQRWIVGDGTVNASGRIAVISNAISTTGGGFPPNFNPASVQSTPFGTITLEFSGCNNATLSFTSSDPNFGSGSVPLQRLTSIANLPCTFLSSGQIDREGRPAINAALIDVVASTGKKDMYNRAADPAQWSAQFLAEMTANAAALDTLDGITGNGLLPPATLASVLVDDRLQIDVSKPACDAYLAVELGVTTACGGRTLARDVIDDSLGALIGPGATDNVRNDSTFLTDFPFAGPPQ